MHLDLRTALRSVVRAQSADAAVHALCQTLASSRSVALVRIWLADERGALRLRGSAGTPSGGGNYTRLEGEFREMAIGDAKIAEIAAARELYVVSGLRGDEEWLINPSWAARQGVRAFAAFPLVDGDTVVGVLALFNRAALSSDVIAQLHLIADITAARVVQLAASVLTRAELRRVERDNIEAALARTRGKVFGTDGAAALLGMRPTTLASRIKALGIHRI